MNNQTVTVNLIPGLSAPAVIRVSQYDVGRPLTIKVFDGTGAASFGASVTATIVGTKPSGLGFTETGTIAGNTVTLNTTLAMTQECGMIPAEIRFATSTPATVIGTANFILAVEPSPHPDGTTDGTQETMADLETRLQAEIDDLSDRIDDIEAGGSGLSSTEKQLILTLFSKAAYAESDAGSAYDALENLWTTTTRTITYNLSHVSSSNTATSVDGGSSYTTTLTADSNYTLNTVTVLMGGVNVTSQVYSSGTITIPSVTGNVVITAAAVLAAQSITATYTQSGTVYDTDSLDSLKADLVVTANYSGGTSETVPSADYTLSGTLSVGTSTITVSYAGLTDTFSVTVSEVPTLTATPSKKTIPSLDTTTGFWQTTTSSSSAAYCGFLFDESMTGGTIEIDWDTDDHSILDVIVTAETDTAWSGIRTHTSNNATYGMDADVTGFSSNFYWFKFAESYQATGSVPTVYQPTANTGHATVELPEGYKAFLVSIRRNSNSTSVNELATDNTSFNNWAYENVTVTVRGGVMNE